MVEVTEKHKDMETGRGRRSRSQNPKKEEMWKERKKGAATGEDDKGGFGKKWRDMVQREGKKRRRKL